MTFLTPIPALLGAAVAVPILLLLYFLKLRRRPVRMASTMLWHQTFEDMQGNVPFQKLRISPLFLLQLLIILLILFALSQPAFTSGDTSTTRVVILVDRSASMNARLPDGTTRFDAAIDAADQIIRQMRDEAGGREGMIIAFADSARAMCTFETDPRRLLEALQRIEPCDEPANFAAALQLTEVYTAQSQESVTGGTNVVLISDGGVGATTRARGFSLRASTFRFVRVGPDPRTEIDNVGIVALTARRDGESPHSVQVFARVLNGTPTPISPILTLRQDDTVVGIEQIQIGAATPEGPTTNDVAFIIESEQASVLTLSHNHRDSFETDDSAALILPPARAPRIALVYDGDAPTQTLRDIVEATRPKLINEYTWERFQQLDQSEINSGLLADVVIFDRVSNHSLPEIPSLTIGGAPLGVPAVDSPDTKGQRLLSWSREQSVLRHVAMDDLVFVDFGHYELPPGATTLAVGAYGPVMAMLNRHDAAHVLVGFDLARSNWPLQVGFTVFIANTLEQLHAPSSGHRGLTFHAGQTIPISAGAAVSLLTINGPDGHKTSISASPDPRLPTQVPAPQHVGLYTVEGALPPMDRIAVSLLDAEESDLRPREQVIVNARAVESDAADAAVPWPLWPIIVSISAIAVVAEWLLYCRRMAV